ncbi:hypothetical protein BU23DRAFT_653128 [Bimuria novae-zelandiae CBS 107.79]|uniref:Uncharacterized protein n=1 Tax=Bimuria novae-zelandiae CBS 107.79 TaxID=1447943 RepID=A0A6A5UWK3_9PLEO|nr:hypothetical protein BU23DRAFT_653128 [Bimuria novae-zelandiae CBS 107.79]
MFKPGGITFLEGIILFCTFLCTLQPIVHFWNSVIGLCVMAFGDAEKSIYPYFDATGPFPEITSRTALTIFMHNEDPNPIFDRLHAMHESLYQAGRLQHFRCDAHGRKRLRPHQKQHWHSIQYGKVPSNWHTANQFVGMPFVSDFSHLTQFGLRHSVPIFNTGLSWWVNDCALFWGHNAIIHTQAFQQNCKLPVLSGKPLRGGHVLSHDIIESMFMCRAGYESRMIPIETASYELIPPIFIDYMPREFRWCPGSMKYWFLLKEPGLKLISRV